MARVVHARVARIQDQHPARAHHGTATTTPCHYLRPCLVTPSPTSPAWLANQYHVPLPHLSLIHNTWTQKQIVAKTSHLPSHTNTKTHCPPGHLTYQHIQTQKHIVLQNISPNKTHKHKTYRPSEHLTQQNTTHIVRQNLPLVGNISTYHILYVRNILCYQNINCRISLVTLK